MIVIIEKVPEAYPESPKGETLPSGFGKQSLDQSVHKSTDSWGGMSRNVNRA